jgi:hypothetical protein
MSCNISFQATLIKTLIKTNVSSNKIHNTWLAIGQPWRTNFQHFLFSLSIGYVECRGGSRISSWGGGHLKKLRRAEGGAKIFGVFRVKNHDFTPIFFSNFRGGARRVRPPGVVHNTMMLYFYMQSCPHLYVS